MRTTSVAVLVLLWASVASGQQQIWTTGAYTYDGSGNVASIGTDTYGYDALGRLTRATVTLPNGQGVTQTYGYDGFGNLTSIVADPPLPTDTTTASIGVSSSTNRLSGWSYDEAGNQISDGVTTLEWDATGSLIARRVNGEEDWLYLYTATDERIAVFRGELKAAGQSGFVTAPTKASWTIRDLDAKPMAVWESSGGTYGLSTITWKRDYVWGFGRLMATIDANGTRHVHTDHLGTPRVITSASGAIVEEHEYYPFGFEATTEGTEPIKFTGHERDLEPYSVNDLDYMHARYYSPVMGRFLSVDPVWSSADLASPQSWNRYSYVRNNPINLTDPDGRNPLAPLVVVGYLCATNPACVQRVAAIGIGAYNVAKSLDLSISMAESADGMIDAADLPDDPEELLDLGYDETSHPDAAKAGHRTFENPETGDKLRFDKGKEGKPGYEGKDHYHRENPNSTGRKDQYLDAKGNPVPRGSDASHLYPKS